MIDKDNVDEYNGTNISMEYDINPSTLLEHQSLFVHIFRFVFALVGVFFLSFILCFESSVFFLSSASRVFFLVFFLNRDRAL